MSNNKFKKLDFSKNAKTLEWVYCFDNPTLKVLDLSGCSKLSYLECSECNLGELDVSKFPELEHLICASCGLKELDLSHNKKLTHLDAFNNPDNGRDYPLNNHLTKLDLSNNKKMKRLDIWANYNLKFVDISVCPGLQYYNCAMIGADHVDVSKNPELIKLNCAYNKKIKTLDLSHNPKLCYLDCSDNKLTGLDLSHNPKLYFLQAFINSFTKLDIGYNPLLIKARKEGKKEPVYNIAHAWILDFGGDDSTGGDQIYEVCYDDKVKLDMTPKYNALRQRLRSIIPDGRSQEDSFSSVRKSYRRFTIWRADRALRDLKPDSRTSRRAHGMRTLCSGDRNTICVGTPDVSSDKFGIGEWVNKAGFRTDADEVCGIQGATKSYRLRQKRRVHRLLRYRLLCVGAICWAATWNIMIGKGEQGAPKRAKDTTSHCSYTHRFP